MYKFSLEPVLNQQKVIEENLQKDVALCLKMLADERAQLERIERAREKCLSELRHKRKRHFSISEMLLYDKFVDSLSHDLSRQAARVDEVKKSFDETRDKLLEVMKKRKVLENLKDKGLKSYRKHALKREQEFLDETAHHRFIRGN